MARVCEVGAPAGTLARGLYEVGPASAARSAGGASRSQRWMAGVAPPVRRLGRAVSVALYGRTGHRILSALEVVDHESVHACAVRVHRGVPALISAGGGRGWPLARRLAGSRVEARAGVEGKGVNQLRGLPFCECFRADRARGAEVELSIHNGLGSETSKDVVAF